jgi:hypothetical protein
MGGRTFNCLDAVISRYKTEQIVEGNNLCMQSDVQVTISNIFQ